VDESESDCHYTFRADGGPSHAKILENKAFLHAQAAGPGGFTPNMGYRAEQAKKGRQTPAASE
jgi:hypothetical protein